MSKNDALIHDFTAGPILPGLVRLAIPFALANLLQAVYTLADMAVVGRFVGSVGMSAVAVGGQIVSLATWMGVSFSSAAQVIVAQMVGAGARDKLNRAIGTIFTVMTLLAIAVTLIIVLPRRWLLGLLNTPAESFEQGMTYLTVCGLGMVFIFGYNVCCAILRGMGDAKRPLMFIAISACMNVVLDLLFVAVFRWGTLGAALATVIGQAFAFSFAMIYLYRRRDSFAFDFKLRSFRPDGKSAWMFLKLGLPMSLQSICVDGSLLYITALVNVYGVAASAISGLGGRLFAMCNIISNSMCTAGTSIVGQNIAAGRPDRCRKSVYCSLAISEGSMLIFIALFLLIPRQIVSLFNTDPDVLALAPGYLAMQALAFCSTGLMSAPMSLMYGVGAVTANFIAAMTDGVFARIGFALLFGNVLGMGLNGYWLGSSLAGFASVLICWFYFLFVKWENKRLIS